MKLICPECSSAFDVPDSMIPDGGRRVRCGSCGHIWQQMAEAPSFGGFRPLDEGEVDPIPLSVHPALEEEHQPHPGAAINWPYLGRMVAGFAAGCVLTAAALYALAANAGALEIRDALARVNKNTIEVSGRVFNASNKPLAVPALDVTPVAPDGTEAESKRIHPHSQLLESGESATFTAELPQGAPDDHIRLRFVQ
jgi:predicted Zn finger-like uncharacterized protein